MNIFFHVAVLGHVHKQIAYKSIYRLPDPQNKCVKDVEQLYVISGAWCNYGGYAARMMLKPGSLGATSFVLSGKKFEYHAIV